MITATGSVIKQQTNIQKSIPMKIQRAYLLMVFCMATILPAFAQTSSSIPTANSFASYKPYAGQYSYGLNPGWYYYVAPNGAWISNWSTQNLMDIGSGNKEKGVKGIGAKSYRMKLTDDYLSTYGLTSLLPDYQHLQTVGAKEIAVFVGEPSSANRLDTVFPGGTEKSKVFKGMYEPIWLDAAQTQINPANTYANYLYNVVKTYGDYVSFWEIVNEPDFTYGAGGWLGDIDPPAAGSWFDHDPTPADLVNLQAPIQYYIRLLRISWEVIKKLQPTDYICTGGIGNRSFLAALLRNTDNPDGGKVTAAFPEKAGAYFDVLSFHTYPEFSYDVKHWDNSIGGQLYNRHSDAAVSGHLRYKRNMDSLLKVNGYNGVQYPAKQFICTETGMSRVMDNDNVGTNDIQRNYMIKCHVKTQMDGQIRQTYWFQTADGSATPDHWGMFGCYYYFGDKMPYNATPTDQGISLKTTSDLLYGRSFDAERTAALQLPSNVDGGAFKAADGSYVYVLWAKTTTDLSETATATYSFPAALAPNGSLLKKNWNFSQTDSSVTTSSINVQLGGTPAFFEVVATIPVPNQAPRAHAGTGQTITLPVNAVQLNGSGTDADGTVTGYSWTQVSGPSQATIASAAQASTAVTNLIQGTYQFQLKVTDNNGATGTDTVSVIVNAAVNQPPVAHAGADQTITLPVNTVTLNGNATDPDGIIASYQWTKISGPASYTITSPSAATTSVSLLEQGVYVFRFTVTDNNGATATDDVQVTVNAALPPPNVAPKANAGVDKIITLPTNSVQLTGSGSDVDGTVVSYQWTKISGPSNYQISSPTTATTNINKLAEGTYAFQLKVWDNAGAYGLDTVLVIVQPKPKPGSKGKSRVALYPNPATTTLNVEIDATTNQSYSTLQIYNSSGTMVYAEAFVRNQEMMTKQIDVSKLGKGVYLLKVNPDMNTSTTLKFVKQ